MSEPRECESCCRWLASEEEAICKYCAAHFSEKGVDRKLSDEAKRRVKEEGMLNGE